MIISNIVGYIIIDIPNNITKIKVNAIDFNGGIKLYG